MRVIPLHVHSHWSLLDGVSSAEQIVAFARDADLPAIALTDSNALYGAMEFVSECRKSGIAPILGAELNLAGGSSLLLLAENMHGYGNLCRLITRMQAAPDREEALRRGLTLSDLARENEGLVALSGGRRGPLDRMIREGDAARSEELACQLAEVFGPERFIVELQVVEDGDARKAEILSAMAERLHLRTVATHDIHYLDPADAQRHRVLTAIRDGTRMPDARPSADLSMPSEEVMRQKFAEFPAALESTEWIAGRCQFDFPMGQWRFPSVDLSSGRTPNEEMAALAFAGASRRYAKVTSDIETRLNKEIDVIGALGYAPYFLVVADIVRFAREQQVPISPRGSASSSVVAYCLGIHDIDPLAYDLYFERFLSPDRRDPPDIDLDLCSERRDEVIRYVYRKYGAEHVAMVCTYATLRARYALREVGKVYGLSDKRIGTLSDQLPGFWHPGARKQLEDAQARMIEQSTDPIEREALEMSRALDGTPHHLSVHPGGIIIAPGPITDIVPLQHATKGLLVTQFDMSGIEKSGLIKIDLLGISALTVIADCVDMIRKDEPAFSVDQIPPQDPATAHSLSTARSIACFQIESTGMRVTLRELSAQNANDLLVALALYRPGPLKGGLKDAFVKRHLGQEKVEFLHPALEPILGETYGVILYQEQVLKLAHEVAGFSLGKADDLRRAMSKYRSAREMGKLRGQFIEGAQSVTGMDPAIAERLWDLMAAFAGYGFPKAHAAGYAAVAYRMAYLKTHYPAQFMAARLGVWGGYYRPNVYMSEARRLGLVVKPPHVNHSQETFSLESPKTLWMGLGQVRELTHATMEDIIARHPFDTLEDFFGRAQPHYVEAVNLAKAGALDSLGNPKAILGQLDRARWHGRHSGQLSLLSTLPSATESEPTVRERSAWEREVLGQWVSVHPLKLVENETAKGACTQSDLLANHVGKEVAVAGIRLAAHRLVSKSESMWLVDMEDEYGTYQVLWDGATIDRNKPLISQREPVLIHGRVRTDRQGEVFVSGTHIRRLL